MGEPVTLYGPDGATVVVYGPAQRKAKEAEGYGLTPPAPDAEPEPVKEPVKVKQTRRRK